MKIKCRCTKLVFSIMLPLLISNLFITPNKHSLHFLMPLSYAFMFTPKTFHHMHERTHDTISNILYNYISCIKALESLFTHEYLSFKAFSSGEEAFLNLRCPSQTARNRPESTGRKSSLYWQDGKGHQLGVLYILSAYVTSNTLSPFRYSRAEKL